jgi:hypothetical protein
MLSALCCCNGDLLVIFCKFGEDGHRLKVWRVESLTTLTPVKELKLESDLNLLKVDDQLIVVTSTVNKICFFISTKTLNTTIVAGL